MSVIESVPPSVRLDAAGAIGRWSERLEGFKVDAGACEDPSILIVDGQEINRRLLRGMLKASAYQILECRKASEAMEMLGAHSVDLIVLDLMLPELSGPDFCRWLKSNRPTRLVPVLMLTSVQGIENEIAGISSGADEFLIKPVHPAVFRTRVKAMLRNKALIDSLEEAETILFALGQTVEQRDKHTSQHCQRLAAFSLMVGEALRLSSSELTALFRGGYLHDIGKISIPDAILFKNGPLTPEEWVIMKSHTTIGEDICKRMRSLAPVLPIIRNHLLTTFPSWPGFCRWRISTTPSPRRAPTNPPSPPRKLFESWRKKCGAVGATRKSHRFSFRCSSINWAARSLPRCRFPCRTCKCTSPCKLKIGRHNWPICSA